MNEPVVAALALLLGLYLWWGIRSLPRERWQVLATVPFRRNEDGSWQGINFTYYGLFNANAYVLAVLYFLVLVVSAGAEPIAGLAAVLAVVGCCAPASRLIARLVEKKAYTFTVGGASFLGLVLAPPFFLGLDQLEKGLGHPGFAVEVGLAALINAYALGEGLGRLACLSFGCCYGKHLDTCSPSLQRLFRRHHTRFVGSNKKAAYEGELENQPLVPVQALTCVLYSLTTLAGTFLFLRGFFIAAGLMPLMFTQGWRVASEFLRADFRGGGRLSAYQVMALIAMFYGGVLFPILPRPVDNVVDLSSGLALLWSPAALLLALAGWLIIFVYTGRSMVTGAIVTLHVRRHFT